MDRERGCIPYGMQSGESENERKEESGGG